MNEFYNKLKYFEQTEGIPSQIYYHYTSLEALFSIVQSRTFRLMSLKSSNDRRELFYKPETFIEDISKLCDVEKDSNTLEFYKLMVTSINEHKELFMHGLKSKRYPFALCLSSKKDNLTHWDRYAKNCTGVAIGLNIGALNVLLDRIDPSGFGIGLLDFGKALYTQDDIVKRIKQDINQGFKILQDIHNSTNEKHISNTIRDIGFYFSRASCNNIIKFAKTGAFLDEDEYRIYFDPHTIDEISHLIKGFRETADEVLFNRTLQHFNDLVNCTKLANEEFALTRVGIRSYHNLCFDEIWGSGVIPEIILGPMCVQNRRELQHFLKSNGLEGTQVKVSNVPIR